MIDIVIINKSGKAITKSVKNLELNNLYLKCGFKTEKDFKLRHIFKIKQNKEEKYIHVYSKNSGKSNTENKFEMPPPIDKELYFGNMLLLKTFEKSKTTTQFKSYRSEEWTKDYENLMGGFENIDKTEDEEEEDELKDVPIEKLTKEGYLKDGFIVSNSDDENYDESDDDSDEEPNEIEKVTINQSKGPKNIKKKQNVEPEKQEDECSDYEQDFEEDFEEEYESNEDVTSDESYNINDEDDESDEEDISELEEEDYIDEN